MDNVSAEQIMMRGSGGVKDYYVVAAKGHLGLGIKILGMQPQNSNSVVYGVRIRTCRLESPEIEAIYGTEEPGLTPEMEAAWKGISWKNSSHTRLSTVLLGETKTNFTVENRELIVPEEIKSGEFREGWVKAVTDAAEGARIVLNDEQLSEIFVEYEEAMFVMIKKAIRGSEISDEVTAEAQKSGTQMSQHELAAVIKKKFVEEFPDEATADDGVTGDGLPAVADIIEKDVAGEMAAKAAGTDLDTDDVPNQPE